MIYELLMTNLQLFEVNRVRKMELNISEGSEAKSLRNIVSFPPILFLINHVYIK